MAKKNFDWMPILKTGTFTAKNKKQVTFDENKLDQIIANTDLSNEPQFVVEHPSFDKLGFGTISSLKRVGQYLFALPKHVDEKFKDAVNRGDLPGRSVSINDNDLSLNHIGFLPKEIEPAVDGLGSYSFSTDTNNSKLVIQFSEDEAHFAEIENDKYEFAKMEISQWPFRNIRAIFRNMKNAWIEKFGQEEADKTFPEWDLEETGTPPSIFEQEQPSKVLSYSQNNNGEVMKTKIELSKITDPALRALVEELQNDLTNTKTELQAATQTISATELQNNRNEVLAFCESDEMKLRILPAEKEKFVAALLSVKRKEKIEFSSPDASTSLSTKVEFTAYDFLKDTFKQLPEKIELSEMATKKNGNEQVPEYVKIGKEIASYVK